jgi:UDP-glucose 4-epimerase
VTSESSREHAILVVGASSPLGRAIGAGLGGHGHRVTRTSRSGSGGLEPLEIGDRDGSRRALEGSHPNAVVCLVKPDLSGLGDHAASIGRAVADLRRFATDCAEFGVRRFVFASSAAVYGTGSDAPLRETDSLNAASSYASLKLRSEEALVEVSRATALPVVSLRVFNVYGPGFSSSLVNRLGLGEMPGPVVHDTESFVRDYIHAHDVARAFSLAAQGPEAGATVANVGTGIGTSNRALLALCPTAPYTDSPDRNVASFSVADISRARALWGFDPRISVETALGQPHEYLC